MKDDPYRMQLRDWNTGIAWIEEDECIRLLGTQQVGRLGFLSGGTAEILPINYAMAGDEVVFSTAVGSKLNGVMRSQVVFEIDEVHTESRSGWSVVVHGRAHEVTERDAPALIERMRAARIEPWSEGAKPHLVRIVPHYITGRRIGPAHP